MNFRTELAGLGVPEGPVALPDGSIAFVDLLQQQVTSYRDGEARPVARLQGAPNGMRLGPDGALYVANNGGVAPISHSEHRFADPLIKGRIQRVQLDGAVSDFATDLPGDGPWRPNDLAFTAGGDLLFTDSQNWEDIDFAQLRPDGSVPGYGGGRVYLADRSGKTRLLAQVQGFANGICLHPDGSVLVGLMLLRRVLKFPWNGRELGEPSLWCQFDDDVFPDGILVHDDRFYAAASLGGKVAVTDLDGRRTDTLACGGLPTNLCVSAGRLWVTAGMPGQLLSCPLE